MAEIRKRMAALEVRTGAKVVRLFIVLATPPGCEFYGFRVSPLWNIDYPTEHLNPDEYFEVHGADREECIERATAMAEAHWLEHRVLVVHLKPLTEPTTTEVTK